MFVEKYFQNPATFSSLVRLIQYTQKSGEPRLYEIYLITNQINEKVYVGQTFRPLNKRFSEHKKESGRGSDQYIHKAMRFYGPKFFTISRLAFGGNTQSEANAAEEFWISFFKSNDSKFGYNQTSGGGAGRTLSEEEEEDRGRLPKTKHPRTGMRPLSQSKTIGGVSHQQRCFQWSYEPLQRVLFRGRP